MVSLTSLALWAPSARAQSRRPASSESAEAGELGTSTTGPDASGTESSPDDGIDVGAGRPGMETTETEPDEPIFDPADIDGDGIPDVIEILTDTDPLDPDTDGDRVPDGVEDANRNGIQDVGERDPRTPGLHHTAAYLPEPMVFDLVRPLGARAGELEVNTLIVTDFRPGRTSVLWAPEIEWAIWDGFAVELELPMRDTELEAVKAAIQWTAPALGSGLAHGVQLLGEVMVADGHHEISALYLLGARIDRISLFGMFGPRTRGPHAQGDAWDIVVNPMIGIDLHETVTVAFESNLSFGLAGDFHVALIPQLHWQVAQRFRLQAGGGARFSNGEWAPIMSMRAIIE